MKKLRKNIIFLILLVCFGCNKDIQIVESKIPLLKNHIVSVDTLLSIGAAIDIAQNDSYVFGNIGGIDIDSLGNIYVLDTGYYFVKIYTNKGEFLNRVELQEGDESGKFVKPQNIAAFNDGSFVIIDLMKRSYLQFGSNGEFKKEVNLGMMPMQLEVIGTSTAYVSGFELSYTGPLIHKYVDGVRIKAFCDRANGWEQIARSGNTGRIVIDDSGRVYYSYYLPYEIKVFDQNENCRMIIRRRLGGLANPKISEDGMTYVGVSGIRGLAIWRKTKIVCLVETIDKGCIMDIFAANGSLLVEIPAHKFGIENFRKIAIDHEGNIWMDNPSPYPHIIKFKLNIPY